MDNNDWEYERQPTYGTAFATVSVKCPYFRNHGRKEIHCESAYGKDAVQILRFRAEETKKTHMQTWCCSCYEKCEWYRTMAQLYDPEG